MENETVRAPIGVEAIDIVRTSPGHRTILSGQVTHFPHSNFGTADQAKCQSEAMDSPCASIQAVKKAPSHSNESDNESLLEEVTCHIDSQSNEHVLPGVSIFSKCNLETMVTDERIASLQHRGLAQITNSLIVSRAASPMVIDSPFDVVRENVAEIIDLTTPTSKEAGNRVHQGSTNAAHFIVPGTSTCHQVLENDASLVDFKAVSSSPVRSSLPVMSLSQLPFENKFFGIFRKPLAELSESCSTPISERQFSDCVEIRSPSFKKNACTSTKTFFAPEDPFCFIDEDEKIENYERVDTGIKRNFQAPATKERQKRKVRYTSWKDDVVHSDYRASQSHSSVRQNPELSIKGNRNVKEKKGQCILDPHCNEPFSKINISLKSIKPSKPMLNQSANENCSRKSSRLKKKINYKDLFYNESCVGFAKPRLSAKLSRGPSRVEPLRSEKVASSPPSPLGSAPVTVFVDPVNLTPPHYPFSGCEPGPMQISPPPNIDMVCLQSPINQQIKKNRLCRKKRNTCVKNVMRKRRNKEQPVVRNAQVLSADLTDDVVMTEDRSKQVVAPHCPILCTSEATTDMKEVRQGSGNVKSLDNDNQAIESGTICTFEESGPQAEKIHSCPDIELRLHMKPAFKPFCLDSMLQQNEVKSASSKVPFTPSHSSQVQLGNRHANLHVLRKGDTVTDRIWGAIKTYVNGVKSENSPMMESVKVNLSTCLATHKAVMNTIKEESLNIAQSAAKVQSACENGMASYDVVLEMLNVIEEVHRESVVAASVRNNDPRTYSQLRQQIYELINEALSPNPREE